MSTQGPPDTLLKAAGLTRDYSVSRGGLRGRATVRAVDDLTFELEASQTLGVVGESGSGKSTLARLVTMAESPSRGTIWLDGVDITSLPRNRLGAVREAVQMVFQDPYGSLNPRKKVGTIIEEPIVINRDFTKSRRREMVRAMMEKVGLRPEHYERYPHMFSGGQRQRIAIARALMLRPKLVVADEPVSALDV